MYIECIQRVSYEIYFDNILYIYIDIIKSDG